MNVLLSCAGHNLRLALKRLEFFVSILRDQFGAGWGVEEA